MLVMYMVCTPSLIREKRGEQPYKRRAMLEGEMFRERKRMQVSCTKCDVAMVFVYLKHHMVGLHGSCVPHMRGVD